MSPQDMFRCNRLSATMRVETCAKRRPIYDACYRCETGDKHVALVRPERLVKRRFNYAEPKQSKETRDRKLREKLEKMDRSHGLSTGRPRHELPTKGATFGTWTVIEESEPVYYGNIRFASMLCRCGCGVEKPVLVQSLNGGKSKQCVKCAGKLRAQMMRAQREATV